MKYDETTVKAALQLILTAVAEDKQEIKELTKDNEMLRNENHKLMMIANEYIQKCDQLNAERQKTASMEKRGGAI